MGSLLNIHCTACALPRTEVAAGGGMIAHLFEAAPGYCAHCETLQTIDVVAPIDQLRALRDGPEPSHVPLPKTRHELLELAVRMRERPRCQRCHEATRRVDLWSDRKDVDGRTWRVACPRCEQAALVVEEVALFD